MATTATGMATPFDRDVRSRHATRKLFDVNYLCRFISCAWPRRWAAGHRGPAPGRSGVRSLAEDFDTATATATANGRLQLQTVLAFSEWWRNSIRERSIAGQAKARTEGRFPGRQPRLSWQQREYIREERSKGVSQRERAKVLEVSRWTIQQADR